MTNGSFLQGKTGKPFVESNESMKTFLEKVNAESSRESYSYAIWQYSQWAKKTPDQLLAERKLENQATEKKEATNGYNALDSAQKFIKHGEIDTVREYATGTKTQRTIKIHELSRKRRELLYAAIRTFYKHNRVALPAEKFTIKENHTDENAVKPRTTYMTFDQGRDIVKASKTPYRELFACQLYGGLGRRETLLINTMWPRLKEEMKGKDWSSKILRLDYNFRKSNDQDDAEFFTFVPAKILEPFKDAPMPFTVKGKPMQGWHLYKVWHNTCKRAGVEDGVRPHLYRDLIMTDGFVNAKIPQEYLQFMTGHTVDKNHYLQLAKKPGKVLEEWQKWKSYVESELVNEATQKELESRDIALQALTQEVKQLNEWKAEQQPEATMMKALLEDPDVRKLVLLKIRSIRARKS
jgi:hypothetical protein